MLLYYYCFSAVCILEFLYNAFSSIIIGIVRCLNIVIVISMVISIFMVFSPNIFLQL